LWTDDRKPNSIASQKLFVRAREVGAEAVLVHHGIFWDGMPRILTGVQYRRVAELIRGDLNLIAYHLPLDRHPELGNNVLAARDLGLKGLEPFGLHEGLAVSFKGHFPFPVAPAELVDRCRKTYGQEPLTFLEGPDPVKTVGIISGGAQREVYQAIAEGLDGIHHGRGERVGDERGARGEDPLSVVRPLRHGAAGHPGAR
jgi:putative NIF3 family GTP cyclohydrolase 1 type 2